MASSSLAPRSDSQPNAASSVLVLSGRAYAWMLALTVITGLEVGLLLLDISPILPLVRQRYEVSYVAAGWAISVTIICHTASNALSGLLANRVGPRVLIVVGMALLAISAITRALAPNFTVLIVSRALTGIGTGPIVIGLLTAITLFSPPNRRVRDQGYFGAAQQLGIMLASLLVPFGVHLLGIATYWELLAGELVIVFVLCVFHYPRSRPQVATAPRVRPLMVVRDRYGWLLVIANMAGYGAFVGVTAWMASFLVERYHTSPNQTGLLTSAALLFAVVGRVAASPLLRVMNVRWLIGGFIMLTGVSLAATPFAPNQQIATLLLLVYSFGSSAPFGAVFGSVADRHAPAGIAMRIMLITIGSNVVALLLPLLIGYTVSLTNDFSGGFWLIAAFICLAAFVVLRSSLGREPDASGEAQTATLV